MNLKEIFEKNHTSEGENQICETFKNFISWGANVTLDNNAPIKLAVDAGLPNVTSLLLSSGVNLSPELADKLIAKALMNENSYVLRQLLEATKGVNYSFELLFKNAVCNGHFWEAYDLLEKKAEFSANSEKTSSALFQFVDGIFAKIKYYDKALIALEGLEDDDNIKKELEKEQRNLEKLFSAMSRVAELLNKVELQNCIDEVQKKYEK